MNYYTSTVGIASFFCSFSALSASADTEYSKIEEEMLLNPPASGSASDKVMIYSRVRNKTIHKAMDKHFQRIENMMFVNTIVESEAGSESYEDDEDCD